MIKKISNIVKGFYLKNVIKTVVWDFDGTIFQSEDLHSALEKEYLNYINKFLLKRRKPRLTLTKFQKLTEEVGSWKLLASKITKLDPTKISKKVDRLVDKSKFVSPDNPVLNKILSLGNYQHVILSNADRKDIVNCLKAMGIKPNKTGGYGPFLKILTRDEGVNKPNLKSFKLVSTYTKHSLNKHLMVGDSYSEDIYPSKKYGFNALHIDNIHYFFKLWTKS